MPTPEHVGFFINDVAFYSKKYIAPATDAAVYQAATGWMTSPKKRKLFDVTLSLHNNVFFVPKSNRSFDIKNADFSFFDIENQTSATVPSVLGGSSKNYLVDRFGYQIKVQTPEGINQEAIYYPYLQTSVSLWNGFEVVGKYSGKVKLKNGNYQVYGFGLKHNLSQYFKALEKDKINLAALLAYAKEEIAFGFLDVTTDYGGLGINRIASTINSYQLQISASKEWRKFELMGSVIANRSNFKYNVSGETGVLEGLLHIQSGLNEKLKEVSSTKNNYFGEISGRYQFDKIYLQTSIAFGKFANANLSVQYEFN